MFDAIHIPELHDEVESHIKDLARHIFTLEIRRLANKELYQRRHPSALLTCYLDTLPYATSRDTFKEMTTALDIIKQVNDDLVAMATLPDAKPEEVEFILKDIAGRFSAMCLEDLWTRKRAGCAGIKVMIDTSNFGHKWAVDQSITLIRTLLHVLKDLPSDLPKDVDEVLTLMMSILRAGEFRWVEGGDNTKIASATAVLGIELPNRNAVVRQAVQTCIELLAELTGRTPYQLLLPHRDRILQNLYTKPLRTLPFAMQIGVIEAIRYSVSLDPPLPELGDELLRLLHETLALAEAEDITLLGRINPRQGNLEIVRLRVACIKLLSASISITDFFSKVPTTRQK
jgi:transformation/transcription domain-associated protein